MDLRKSWSRIPYFLLRQDLGAYASIKQRESCSMMRCSNRAMMLSTTDRTRTGQLDIVAIVTLPMLVPPYSAHGRICTTTMPKCPILESVFAISSIQMPKKIKNNVMALIIFDFLYLRFLGNSQDSHPGSCSCCYQATLNRQTRTNLAQPHHQVFLP